MLSSSRPRSSGGEALRDRTGCCRRCPRCCLDVCQCECRSTRHAADNYRSMFSQSSADEQWERDSLEDIDRKVKNRILRRNILKRLTKETESTRNRRSTTFSSVKRSDCSESRSRSSSAVRSMSSGTNNTCKSHSDSKQVKNSREKSICSYFTDSKLASLKPMVLNFHKRYTLPYPSKESSRKSLDHVNKYSSALKRDFAPPFLDRSLSDESSTRSRVGSDVPASPVGDCEHGGTADSEHRYDDRSKSGSFQRRISFSSKRSSTLPQKHSGEFSLDTDSGLSDFEVKSIEPIEDLNVASQANIITHKELHRSCGADSGSDASRALSPPGSLYHRTVVSPLGSTSSSSGVADITSGSDTTKFELNSTGVYDYEVPPCSASSSGASETNVRAFNSTPRRSPIGSCANTSDSRSSLVAKFHEKYSSIFKNRNGVTSRIDKVYPHTYDLVGGIKHQFTLGSSSSSLSTFNESRSGDFRSFMESPYSAHHISGTECFSPVSYSSVYSSHRSSPDCSNIVETEQQLPLTPNSNRSTSTLHSSHTHVSSNVPLILKQVQTQIMPTDSDLPMSLYRHHKLDCGDITDEVSPQISLHPNEHHGTSKSIKQVVSVETSQGTQIGSHRICSDVSRFEEQQKLSHISSDADVVVSSDCCPSAELSSSSEDHERSLEELASCSKFNAGNISDENRWNIDDTCLERDTSNTNENLLKFTEDENLSSSEYDKSRGENITGNTEPDCVSFDPYSLKRSSSVNVIGAKPRYDSLNALSCGSQNSVAKHHSQFSPMSSSTNNLSAMDCVVDRGMGRKVFSCDVGSRISPRKLTKSSKQWFRKFSSIGHISPVAQSHLRLKRRPSKVAQASESRASLGAQESFSSDSMQCLTSSINRLNVTNELITDTNSIESSLLSDCERLRSLSIVAKRQPTPVNLILPYQDDECISDQTFPEDILVSIHQPTTASVGEMLPPEAAVSVATASVGLAGVPTGLLSTRTRPAAAVPAMVRPDVSATPGVSPLLPPQLDLRQQEQLLTVDRSIDRLMKERDRLKTEITAYRARSACFHKRVAEETIGYVAPITSVLEQKQCRFNLDRDRLLRERDEAHEELIKMQTLFSDLNRKFEKSRGQLAETEQQCSLTMVRLQEATAALSTQKQKYQILLQHSQDKLISLNAERGDLGQSSERELLQMRAKLRLKENKLGKLEQENLDLTKLCDELIAKMGDADV